MPVHLSVLALFLGCAQWTRSKIFSTEGLLEFYRSSTPTICLVDLGTLSIELGATSPQPQDAHYEFINPEP